MFTTKEYAQHFGITDANLRKWCMELEKQGYKFFKEKKAKNDVRYFQDYYDKPVFEHLQMLLNDNMSLEMACKLVVQKYGNGYEPGNENLNILAKNDSGTDIVPLNEIQALRAENTELRNVLKLLVGEVSQLKELVIQQANNDSKKEIINKLDEFQNQMKTETNQMKIDVIETITKSRNETHSKKKSFFSKFLNI